LEHALHAGPRGLLDAHAGGGNPGGGCRWQTGRGTAQRAPCSPELEVARQGRADHRNSGGAGHGHAESRGYLKRRPNVLRDTSDLADDARRVNERDPKERLAVPPVDDELGRLATSFNGLLDRLSAAMNLQRQFMANASHELRTPVSVVRTATQVTLATEERSADEYRESLHIIGGHSDRFVLKFVKP
jgi:signal transduction histidine kinase